MDRYEPSIVVDDGRPMTGKGVPRPRIAEVQRRRNVQRRRLGSRVANRHPHTCVVDVCLGVIDGDLEVAIVIEDPRVDELVLRIEVASPVVLVEQLLVRELSLWVDVPPTHPRMSQRRVEVPPILLRVLAVVTLVAVQSEDPLLDDGIASVPKSERQAQMLRG